MTTFKYPLSVVNGGLVLTADDDEVIAGAIKSAVLTDKGERVLRPTYGTNAQIFELLADLGAVTNDLEADIDDSITDYPTTVTRVLSTVNNDGQILVNVLYATDSNPLGDVVVNV